MRTIKFRGKRVKDGQWIYGNLADYSFSVLQNIINKKVIFSNIVSFATDNFGFVVNDCEVAPATVGQFTGLLDKNGKEIYEGDILLLNTTGLREHCIVEWNSEKAGWCISLKVAGKWKLGVRTLGAWMNEADFRIQGNRFDNPELLNEK